MAKLVNGALSHCERNKFSDTSVQAAETPSALLAADACDLLQFLNKLLVFPAEDWNKTWAADRTMMLRTTSKKAEEIGI